MEQFLEDLQKSNPKLYKEFEEYYDINIDIIFSTTPLFKDRHLNDIKGWLEAFLQDKGIYLEAGHALDNTLHVCVLNGIYLSDLRHRACQVVNEYTNEAYKQAFIESFEYLNKK